MVCGYIDFARLLRVYRTFFSFAPFVKTVFLGAGVPIATLYDSFHTRLCFYVYVIIQSSRKTELFEIMIVRDRVWSVFRLTDFLFRCTRRYSFRTRFRNPAAPHVRRLHNALNSKRRAPYILAKGEIVPHHHRGSNNTVVHYTARIK